MVSNIEGVIITDDMAKCIDPMCDGHYKVRPPQSPTKGAEVTSATLVQFCDNLLNKYSQPINGIAMPRDSCTGNIQRCVPGVNATASGAGIFPK